MLELQRQLVETVTVQNSRLMDQQERLVELLLAPQEAVVAVREDDGGDEDEPRNFLNGSPIPR